MKLTGKQIDLQRLSLAVATVCQGAERDNRLLLEAIACVGLEADASDVAASELLRVMREHVVAQADTLKAFALALGDSYAMLLNSQEDAAEVLRHRPAVVASPSGAELYEQYVAEHRVEHAGGGHLS